MKKRLLSALLALCTLFTLLPTVALAAEGDAGNFADENVTWIGTQEEFSKTLDGFYNDGLRKVEVAGKWGIMDATGAFVAPPIYDKIELAYAIPRDALTQDPLIIRNEARERLFMNGYTQCTRGGKMGLLNQYGEEAIPAQYDAVGLPSEGICRIIKKSGDVSYLGYWSLALGRELVAPNKYVVSGWNARAEGSVLARQMLDTNWAMVGLGGRHQQGAGSATIDYEEYRLSEDRLAVQHDYMDGYTLVTTGSGNGVVYGTILDSTGKEILPGGPYPFRPGTYPQFGPYMIYVKVSDKDYIYNGINLGRYFNSGVVGPAGIIIPAQYNGGARKPFTGAEVGDARMTIIPELKLVITAKDTKIGQENGGRVGVVNFKNETVIPFTHDFNYFDYNPSEKVFYGMSYDGGDRIYTASGKRLNNANYSSIGDEMYTMVNGYTKVVELREETANGQYKAIYTDKFLNLKTGAEFAVQLGENNGAAPPYSNFSVHGLVWVKNPENKWGLLNGKGEIVLPYQYDKIYDITWTNEKNGYAIVNIGQKQGIVSSAGKVLIPCEYENLEAPAFHGSPDPEYVEATKNGKIGLLSTITGKLVIPCSYDDLGGYDEYMYRTDYLSLGAQAVKTADGYALVDKNGNLVPGSANKSIAAPKRGLFLIQTFNGVDTNSFIGPEGKIVIPSDISYEGNKALEDSETTLVVKDGKVGYINAGLLARPTQPKTLNPATAAASPSPTKLIVDGKSVAASAYLIGQNNYVKLRDLAYLVNGTGKNFEVTWDGAKNAINLKSNTKYTTVKGDMTPAAGGAQTATRSNSAVYVDGLGRSLTAYTINGNNYFKLRDVMRVFDIAVGYDNTTATATLNTSLGYTLTDGEKAGITPAPGFAEQTKTRNTLKINKLPVTEYDMTKNHSFDTTGMNVTYFDENGDKHDVPISELTFTADGDKITDGYVFKTSSIKNATVSYKDVSASFRIFVKQGVPEVEIDPVPGATDKALADGKYTISCLGNTFGMSNGWMVLDSKKPITFDVAKENDYYYIYLNETTRNSYIGISPINSQLISNSKVKWTITNLGGDTYSVRQYDKQDMVVNASGNSSADGTKVIVWKSKATPKNAILTFTPAK